MNNYFKNCKTIQEIKEQYKKLAKQYHIDLNHNVNPNIMKEINIQYDEVLKIAIKYHNDNKKDNQKDIKFNENEEKMFKNIISKIVTYPNLKIKIVGSWIWLDGLTYPIKDELKKLNFKWSSNRKLWYFNPKGNKSYNKGYRSNFKKFKDIEEFYGSKTINSKKAKQLN